MKVYIDKASLENSIDYFTRLDITSPEQLGLFFFFKSIGVTTRKFVPFKKSREMSLDQKDNYYKKLHHLGGVYTAEKEKGGKRTCLFPFSIQSEIKHGHFFNGKTPFKNLLSRLKDTIDNSLVDKGKLLDKDQDENIKFKRNYIQSLNEEYLKGNKISIIHFSTWFCRFVSFDVEEHISPEDFTRMCIKYTINYLNVYELELQELFYDDSFERNINFSEEEFAGSDLRELLYFSTQGENEPEVEVVEQRELNIEPISISFEESRRYIEMSGSNPNADEIKDVLDLREQIVLYGVPGVGKTKFISEIESEYDEVIQIQFHPSTSYEDFIGGSTIKEGSIVTRAGKFLETCLEASKPDNSDKKYLFVIDEMNRGNLPKIFGETILALDREYEVDLIKPIEINGSEISSFKIPENIHIVATMNTTDRSIAMLDYAIRRRFAFIKLYPNYEVVKDKSNLTEVNIYIEQLYKALNNNIKDVLGDEDLLLGQSYFLPKYVQREEGKLKWTKRDLRIAFNYSIIPILEEYTYGDNKDLISIVGERLASRMYDNEEFIEEIKNQYPETIIQG